MTISAVHAINGVYQTAFDEKIDNRHREYSLYLRCAVAGVPTALFVAMTLMWVITSIGGLVW